MWSSHLHMESVLLSGHRLNISNCLSTQCLDGGGGGMGECPSPGAPDFREVAYDLLAVQEFGQGSAPSPQQRLPH